MYSINQMLGKQKPCIELVETASYQHHQSMPLAIQQAQQDSSGTAEPIITSLQAQERA